MSASRPLTGSWEPVSLITIHTLPSPFAYDCSQIRGPWPCLISCYYMLSGVTEPRSVFCAGLGMWLCVCEIAFRKIWARKRVKPFHITRRLWKCQQDKRIFRWIAENMGFLSLYIRLFYYKMCIFLLKNVMFYLFIFKSFYLSSSLNTVSMCDVCVWVNVPASIC